MKLRVLLISYLAVTTVLSLVYLMDLVIFSSSEPQDVPASVNIVHDVRSQDIPIVIDVKPIEA